ncbi:hypothetical protein QYE76_046070 [Lolium multiflorum]|uniref:Uncharacterized protein n=1 Tax=Lolium multiflorum TaxID=4521 RepID=A0AAD8TP75_LOLMU|nr:hypothetical protein QYE76_046070 [Lolium multiflorum]
MLPYATAAEAEAALGRVMTSAEAAWFRYSAALPDPLLYCLTIAIVLLVYTLVGLPLALVELSAPADDVSVMQYKLQPRVRLSPAEFLRCYLDSVRLLVLYGGGLSVLFDFPFNPTNFIPFYGGARHHDYHHRVGSQSNFAPTFTYCDYLYGTDKGYTYHNASPEELPKEMTENNVDEGQSNQFNNRKFKYRSSTIVGQSDIGSCSLSN